MNLPKEKGALSKQHALSNNTKAPTFAISKANSLAGACNVGSFKRVYHLLRNMRKCNIFNPILDINQQQSSSSAALSHKAVWFDNQNIVGNSNAALLQTTAAFILSMFWLNQLVGQMREGFYPASFLRCWFVNLHLTRLFRLTTKEACTSTVGAN